MSEIYFENLNGDILCFRHAVKAALESDERITAYAPDVRSPSDMYDTGWFPGVCVICMPPEEDIEEDGIEEDIEEVIETEEDKFHMKGRGDVFRHYGEGECDGKKTDNSN